jgi:glycerophosphoryl diester phosphodiesterase
MRLFASSCLLRAVLFSLPVLALSACGGGSDGSGGRGRAEQQGVFVDHPVEGLQFVTPSRAGLTNRQGEFRYLSGESVRFLIGSIELGSAAGQAVLTPLNLVPGAASSDRKVTNLLRLLQTLDSDCDIATGIQIGAAARSAAAGRSLNFDQSEAAFASDPAVMAFLDAANTCQPLVDGNTARAAFQRTLDYMAAHGGRANRLPTANAGLDLIVNENTPVTLNGSGSDPDGSITAFQWTQTAGPAVTLAGANSANTSFTAPNVETDTVLVFRLRVTDDGGAGALSAVDEVRVTVRAQIVGNQAPTARAGLDQSVNEGEAVTLDGSASSDPEDGSNLSYQWTQTSGPTVTLTGADTAMPGFTAPQVDATTALIFQLVVRDTQNLASAPDTVTVTVNDVPPGNTPPVADAGADRTVAEGAAVELNGGASSDPDGTIASYNWTQLSGPAVTLSGANTATPAFTAPQVAGDASLVFRLTVTDNGGASDSDEVQVTVVDNTLLSVADATQAEGDSGMAPMTFTVRLSEAQPAAVTVDFATEAVTATEGLVAVSPADYARTSGSLTFAPGETEKTVGVTIVGDRFQENDETFRLLLSNIAGAAAGDTTAIGTIKNDDALTLLQAGAAKRSVTPTDAQIAGQRESYLGGTRQQFFHLGGFGFGPFKFLPSYGGATPEVKLDQVSNPQAKARCFSPEIMPGNITPEHCEDETWVRVLVLREPGAGGDRVAFVTLDAVGAGNLIQDAVKAAVHEASCAEGACIAPENVLFGQTHTHAGADLQGLWGGVPREWIEQALVQGAAAAVREALRNSKPAELVMARGYDERFNNYRRPRYRKDPALHEADPTVTMLQARADDGSGTLGTILQYAAHPTAIGTGDYRLADGSVVRVPHPDYPLGAENDLEEVFGGTALYYNGPIADASASGGPGDANPYRAVKKRGAALAASARAILEANATPLDPVLETRSVEVTLPITNPLFVAIGLGGVFNGYYQFSQLPFQSIPGLDQIPPEVIAQFEDLQNQLPQPTPVARTQLSRVSIGTPDANDAGRNRLEIVTIPGEATNSFGQYIRRLANEDAPNVARPKRHTMLLGLTHNSFGYIIPEEEFSYVDPSGEAGFVLPFTGYEEFVSLGPLTAPLLRVQGYNPLFDAAPEQYLPPWLADCRVALDYRACIVGVLQDRLAQILAGPAGLLGTIADGCREFGGPGALCGVFDTVGDVIGGVSPPGGGADGDQALLFAALDAQTRGCDILDTANCLYPFPNDWFTVPAAPGSIQAAPKGTGRRVNISPLATPRNSAGKPVDPSEWNRNDGFSPGALITTYVPGLSLEKTFGLPSHQIGLANIGLSQDPDAPILVLEVSEDEAPKRHLVWSELDQNANQLTVAAVPNVGTFPIQGVTDDKGHVQRPLNDGRAALLIRPAKNFSEGKRYVVVLRNLKDANGQPIPAQAGFRACLSGASALPPVQQRCEQLEDKVFPVLEAAGIALDDSLYLAWDFTVASTQNQIGRLRHMRDDAFRTLSADPDNEDCTQLTAANLATCAAPKIEITGVTENPQSGIARRIEGTITVPNYLAPIGPSPLDDPNVSRAVNQFCASAPQGEFSDGCRDLRDAVDIAQGLALPNRLFYNPADGAPTPDAANALDPTGLRYGDGLPDRNGSLTTRFLCQIPAQATPDNPARASLYGHGQLDRGVAITYEGTPEVAREHNYMFCAVDWFGFRTGDAANVLTALVDLSNFPVIPDASQQGMLNFLFLARAMQHPQGFASRPEFQDPDSGRPVFDRSEIFYNGNSQGGIFGGVVLAASKDVNRGVLGSLGMNYSTLLTRSKNFDEYAGLLYNSYTDPLDRQLLFSMIQMLWDRSENNGYAAHLIDNSAFGGPSNAVKLDTMYGDPQVTMFSAEVMARTMGVPYEDRQLAPAVARGAPLGPTGTRHPTVEPYYGLEPLDYGNPAHVSGSALYTWDTADNEDAQSNFAHVPPTTNTPPRTGPDRHDASQKRKFGRCHMAHFLRTGGQLIDILPVQYGGAACPAVPPAAPTTRPEEPTQVAPDYGSGLLGALAQYFARLHGVVVALVSGDPAGAGGQLVAAVTEFVQNIAGVAGGADPQNPGTTLIGLQDEPQAVAEQALSAAREVEPVVLTGERIPAWSVPAAQGLPYPYPSGAATTGGFLPASLQKNGGRSAHNGQMVYPAPGAPMGVEVARIAAYKYENGGFTEIPVQVDQKFPHFLANSASDFSTYSGTDEELTYQWDSEKWNAGGEGPNAEYPPATPDPVSGLDHDDEVVFMARDAGTTQAPPQALPTHDADFDASGGLQEVVLADPLDPATPRFVYLGLKKPGRTSAFAGARHYVQYQRDDDADQWIDRRAYCDDDPEKIGTSNTGYGPNRSGPVYYTVQGCGSGPTTVDTARRESDDRFPRDGVTVSTDTYRWYASGRWMVRELQIRDPDNPLLLGPDLVDRWKGRAFQQSPDSTISVVGFEDEQVNWEANSTLLGERCGPVRCIREVWGADSGTNVTKTETFYRDAITYRYRVRVHPIPPDGLYTSWDYNRSAMLPAPGEDVPAGRYFTALRPQGVPIDGVNDDVGQVDGIVPVAGQCITPDGLQAPGPTGLCPAFFDSADPSFNLPLAFHNWEQVSGKGRSGSLVYLFELKGPTSLANPLVVPYYRDDACLDDGTGDDPVPRPWPGESYTWNGGKVPQAYNARAGRPLDHSGRTFADCLQRQGAHGAHGIHYFATHDSDNLFVEGKPLTEIDGQQWQFMVPTERPRNVGDRYANVVRAPLQAVVVPRPGSGGGGGAEGLLGALERWGDALMAAVGQLRQGNVLGAFNAVFGGAQQFVADVLPVAAQQLGQLAGLTQTPPGVDAVDNPAPEPLMAGVAKGVLKVPVGTPLGGYLRPPVGGEYIGDDPDGELLDNIPALADGCDPAHPESCPPLVPLPDELRAIHSPYATYSPPSRGYYDSLITKAVALHDGHDYLVLVKTDFIGMLDEVVQDVKAEVKRRTGIDLGDGLIMSATHTHDGPGAVANHSTRYFWLAMDVYQHDVYRRLVPQLADVVVAALENMQPARIGHASGLESPEVGGGNGLNGYRRGRFPRYATDDRPGCDLITTGSCPAGLNDADELRKRIGVLRVDDASSGQPLAVVINFADHGIAFDVENQYFSGDVLGSIEREVEQSYARPEGAGDFRAPIAMLVQNTGGDVTPKNVEYSIRGIEALGKRMAPQVRQVADAVSNFQTAPDLRSVSQRIVLNRDRLGYAAQEYPYPWGAGQCGNDIAVPFAGVGVKNIPGYEQAGLPVKNPFCLPSPPPDPADLADNGVAENGAFYPQDTILTVARIGDITLLVQPGEPLTEYGVRLLEMARNEGYDPRDTFIWGYAGDHVGYILPPEEDDWASFGGAESTTTFWGWKQGQRFLDVSRALLQALDEGSAPPPHEFQVNYGLYKEKYEQTPPAPVTPSLLPGVAVTQPDDIRRFEATRFVFEGGDPVLDLPAVEMQQLVDGQWQVVRRANGEPLDTFFEMHLKYRLVSARHLWTVEFEAPKDWPTGIYRFVVSGQALQSGETPYTLTSDSFTVSVSPTLQISSPASNNGHCEVTLSYTPRPSNYRVIDPYVPANQPAPVRAGTVTFSVGSTPIGSDDSATISDLQATYSIPGACPAGVSASAVDIHGNTTPGGGPTPPDADGDGVPDASDACPNEPGPASNNGCPEQTGGGFPLCLEFQGDNYCLSDLDQFLPVPVGGAIQGAVDTAYNTIAGGGSTPPPPVTGVFLVGTGEADHNPTGRVCFGSGSMCSRSADPSTEPDAIRDPLISKATAITGANGDTFILVTTTNIGYFLAYKAEQSGMNGIYDVRLRIAQATGVPSTHIVVVSDHSHNGPDTIGIWGGVSAEYMKITADAVVAAARQAFESRRPAVIRVAAVNQNEDPVPGVPRLDSSYDRPPGNDLTRGNPYNEFRMLVADDAGSGERILTLVNYAPHATVTNGDTFNGKYRLTGDWAAWATQIAAANYGGMGLATIGTVGSTDWNKSGNIAQREAEARARLNTLMAVASARLQPVDGAMVKVESTFIREPMTQPALLLNYKPGLDYNDPNLPTAGRDLRIDRSVLPPFLTGTVVGTYVSAIRIGDVFISTFPGEPFGELDHAIKDEGRVQGARAYFLLGGANDFFGYMVKNAETFQQTFATGALWLAGCPEEDFAKQVGIREEGEGACSDHWTLMVSPTIGSHIVCTLQDAADRLGFATDNRDPECPALTALDGLAPPLESDSPVPAHSQEGRNIAVAKAHALAEQCRSTAAPAALCDALAAGAKRAEAQLGADPGNPWLDRRILNISHRGGAKEFPENTLFAYAESLKAGSDMIEADVYQTADGELVVIHDASVDRTTNGSGAVNTMTLAQLKALDAAYWFTPGSEARRNSPGPHPYRGMATGAVTPPPGYSANDFRIPTLRELLQRFPDTLINLELKPDERGAGSYEGKLAALLAEYGRSDDVIVASFLDSASAVFKAQAPQVSTSVPTAQVAVSVVTGQGPSAGATLGHDAFQVPIEFSGVPVTSQEFVDDAHAQGMAVHVWTIDDAATMRELLCMGVDGIMTDRPSVLEDVLNEDWQSGCGTPVSESGARSPGLLGLLADYLGGLGQALLLALSGDMTGAQEQFLAAAQGLVEGAGALLTDDPDYSLAASLERLGTNLAATLAGLAERPGDTPTLAAGTLGDLRDDAGRLLGTSRVVPDAEGACAPDNTQWTDYGTYKGSLHAHSGYSDGAVGTTPASYFAAAKQHGVDFIGSSEHSDNALLPLTVNQGCLSPDVAKCVTPLPSPDEPAAPVSKWQLTLQQARAASDGNFTAFRGFEWTSDRFGHINVFFSRHDFNAKSTEGYTLSMESFWTWFATRPEFGGGADGLAVFNHPGREDQIESNGVIHDPAYAFNGFEYRPEADLRMVGIEVFGKSGDAYDTDNGAPPGGWYAFALDRGWHVGAVGAEDEHGTRWAQPERAKTILIARDRSEGALREAMFARRFYALAQNHNDLRLSFTADGLPMGARLARAEGAQVLIEAAVIAAMPAGGKLELVTNGGQVAAESLTNTLSHSVSAVAGERWYYLRVLRSDGRPVAYSSPLWIKGGGGEYPLCGEWLAGDLHVHSTYSHDSYGGPNELAGPLAPVAKDLLPGDDNTGPDEFYTFGLSVRSQFRIAAARGLDYLAITDHNDIRSQSDPGFGAFGVLPLRSYENSLNGHAQMHGATRIYDRGDQSAVAINAMANALRADGGVFQINHPADGGGFYPDNLGWRYGFDVKPDTVEVWNIGARFYQAPFPANTNNDDSTRYWEEWLNRGAKVAATGGSDSHWASLAAIQGAGMPSTWIFVTERSERGLLTGLKQGRTFISHLPPLLRGPRIELEADRDGDGVFESRVGDSVPADAELRVRVSDAAGAVVRIVGNGGSGGLPPYRQTLGPVPATMPAFEYRFRAPANATWLRAEVALPDGQAQRQQLEEPLCAQVGLLGENGFPEDTRTTYCRNQLAVLAMSSALYLQ